MLRHSGPTRVLISGRDRPAKARPHNVVTVRAAADAATTTDGVATSPPTAA